MAAEIGRDAVWSETDASNNSGTMPSWDGAADPNTIDDAGRAMMGAIKREWSWRNYTETATGTADAKVLTYAVAPVAFYNGQRFAFIANTTNTGSVTLNVNSLGAKTIKKIVNGSKVNLAAGEMVSGMYVEVAYHSGDDNFVWVGKDTRNLVVKPALQNTSADVTMSDDDDLRFSTEASGDYRWEMTFWVDTNATADFRFDLDLTGGAPTTFRYGGTVVNNANNTVEGVYGTAIQTAHQIVSASATEYMIVLEGVIYGATAGSFRLRWRQNTSDAGTTGVRKGSALEWEKL
jgi:hypothetical protein